MASRKVSAGQPFMPSAGEWNRHVDTADYIDRERLGTGGQRPRGYVDTSIVRTKNSSGATRRKGDILEFTGLAFTNLADDERGWMVGGSPTLVNGIGVVLRSVPNNEFEDVQVAGAASAWVNVTNTSHVFAKVSSGLYVLQSALFGPVRILWKPAASTGELACKVLLGQGHALDQSFIGKPADDYDMGEDAAEIELYDKYNGSALGGSLFNCIILTRDVLTTDWVSGTIINGVPHASPVDCEEEA